LQTQGIECHWSLPEGGSRSGPDMAGSASVYSSQCLEGHAGRGEFGLAARSSILLPEQVEPCEAADFSLGCGSDNRVVALRVGSRRLTPRGFCVRL
jgi:hypothetical protein